jgi:uncharacterized BrkB/YihY/UPF0761 family membrane protein
MPKKSIPPKEKLASGPTWKNRRRVIFSSLIFCACVVAYLVLEGKDTKLHETIAWSAFALAFSVIGGYVFGAVWDDKNVMTHRK